MSKKIKVGERITLAAVVVIPKPGDVLSFAITFHPLLSKEFDEAEDKLLEEASRVLLNVIRSAFARGAGEEPLELKDFVWDRGPSRLN